VLKKLLRKTTKYAGHKKTIRPNWATAEFFDIREANYIINIWQAKAMGANRK
jgi:hypothetical protein